MKKIFAIGIALLTLVSCKMDFYSSDSMTSSQLADNPSSAVYTTDGLYTLMKDRIEYKGLAESGNYYVRHYFQLTELRGDNVTVSGVTEDPFVFPYTYNDVNTEKNITYTWWMAYKIINAANSNIDAIVPGSSALSDHLLGENYFFRALMHFHLVTLFATPYVCGADKPGVVIRRGLDISSTTRSTVGDVYNAIVEDLISAQDYLKNGESDRIKNGEKVYVSWDAATALLARVYLYMEKNKECIAECNKLMEHPSSSLDGYDFDTYPTHTYDSPETIWCLRLTTNDEWANDHAEASIASMYIKDGHGWGEHYWREDLIENFRRYPADKRFKAYFRMVGGTPQQIRDWDDMVASTGGKVMITFPIRGAEDDDHCGAAVVSNLTQKADNSIDFTYDGKNYTAVPKTVNTYTEYWVDGVDFSVLPIATGSGKSSRVFVRPNIPRDNKSCRTDNGADYVRYFNTKFSYQDGLVMLTSPVFLRWGEVLLNRAEAYAKIGGKDSEALADVNRIRHRAGLDAAGDDFTTGNYAARGYESVLDVVLDERNRELCFEGHRMFDVFRNRKKMDRRYTGFHPWEVIDYTDPRIALLISQDEINASGIPQNAR